ncbi:hypothetical protein T4E_8804 [Trichinella pseudospiralis]|uniref:Uncharacterized protein n=1 Tax=Trichinella pseudospiralis TaxID=6337 RepID=A0A0V0YK80_TRIPS|nr:hypothetical protein T4E_8804 [Trichinella pseudospiralis]
MDNWETFTREIDGAKSATPRKIQQHEADQPERPMTGTATTGAGLSEVQRRVGWIRTPKRNLMIKQVNLLSVFLCLRTAEGHGEDLKGGYDYLLRVDLLPVTGDQHGVLYACALRWINRARCLEDMNIYALENAKHNEKGG